MEEIINGLLIVLVPMMLGYLVKIQNQNALAFINKIVMLLLYIILFYDGIYAWATRAFRTKIAKLLV